ncbi:MAG: hypothetical protein AAF487_04355 [Bacteroidota bacterium]
MIEIGLKHALIIALFGMVACAGNTEGAKNASSAQDKDKLFSSESGYISYELKGMQKGTEILYWDDWGNKQRKETEVKIEMMGFSQTQNSITLTLGDIVYAIDEEKNTATKMKNDFLGDASNQEKREFGYRFMEEMGGKKVGEEQLLGKTCEKWTIPDMYSTVYYWKTYLMKSETDMMGMKQIVTATEIKLDASVEKGKFDISSYSIKDLGSVQDYLNRN